MNFFYIIILLVSINWFPTVNISAQINDSNWIERAKKAVEAAVPIAEKDPNRPVYHYLPPAQWMNDICGAIYYNGCYHAFYQYNPFYGDDKMEDYKLWAHTRSHDLVHWEELPWALAPMREKGERRCNSGSITLDGNGRPMLFYTFVPLYKEATVLGKREMWAAVPLDDDLIKWKRVKDEPLLAAGKNGVPEDIRGAWSDPFIFKSDGRTFVTFKSCKGMVAEAKDKEFTQWKTVGFLEGVTGECPNFFPLQDKWVLLRSTKPVSYVIGDFDADSIRLNTYGEPIIMDYSYGVNDEDRPKDRVCNRGLYGTSAFTDDKGRRILLGWVSGFRPGLGWAGCMSLPRILTLNDEFKLIQTPAPELQSLRGEQYVIKDMKLSNEEKKLHGIVGDALEIEAVFKLIEADAFGLKLRQSSDGQSAVTLKYENDTLYVSGTKVPLQLKSSSYSLKLHVFIDKSVMEVFINDGESSVTRVEYPGIDDLGVSVFAENGTAVITLDAWKMKSYKD